MGRVWQRAAGLGGALALILSAQPVWAQAVGPISPRGVPGYTTPPVSPWINLNRAGSPLGVNYYGLVRPEFQFQNALQSLQGQVNALGATTTTEGQVAGLPLTGHPAVFMNYSHYYGSSLRTPLTGPVSAGGSAAVSRPTTPTAGMSPPRGTGQH